MDSFPKQIIITIIFLSIRFCNNSYCGSFIPYNGDSCFQYTNSSSICCYLRGNFEGNYHSMCYPFSRKLYYKMSRHVKINGYLFTLDCGRKRGALCGDVVNPVNYKDCSIYSTTKNSCCFYKYRYKNPLDNSYQEDTNCVWLGTPDIGQMDYNKLTVICKQNYYKLKTLFFFVLIISLIF